MKMAPGLFWGVLLVLIGLAAIFRVVFDVNLFGVLFALFLIFVGISLLVGKPWMFTGKKVNMILCLRKEPYVISHVIIPNIM